METPHVSICRARLKGNIERMQRAVEARGVALRPHAKTHKSFQIAQMQLDAGAVGITCSKSQEAAGFLVKGIDTLLAYPLADVAKVERVVRAAKEGGTNATFTVDSIPSVELLKTAAERLGSLRVRIKVDVGLGRCGASPSDAVGLKRFVDASDGLLELRGILSHAGHAYRAGLLSAARFEMRRSSRALAAELDVEEM